MSPLHSPAPKASYVTRDGGPAMAATVSSSRCSSHDWLLRLVAAAAVLAALAVGAAARPEAGNSDERVLLNVDSLFPAASCPTPQGLFT